MHRSVSYLILTGVLAIVPGAKAAAQDAPATANSEAPAAVRLGTVRVAADTAASKDAARTEDSGSYGAATTTIGRGARLRETPQSTTVITRQLLDDRNLDTLEAAVEQSTGASVLQIDAARSNFFFRGFSLDTIQLDGVSVAFTSNFATSPDLFAYDRVEIVRGPAGLFQGAGEPAAGVNLARKRARDTLQLIAGAGLGSFDYKRVEADVTGPLVKSGKVRARLLGSYEDRGSFIDRVQSKKPMVYGTIEVDPAPDTTLSAGVTYQNVDYLPFAGLPAYADGRQADVPRSRFIGAAWNDWVAETTDMFVEADHHREGGPQFKLTGRRVERSTDAQYATPNTAISPTTGLTRLNVVRLDYRQIDKSVDGFASVPFTVGSLEQNILIGANYRDWTFDQNTGNGTPFDQNVFAPVYTAPRQTVNITNRFVGTQTQYGAYGQARLKLARPLTVILGGRLSSFETKTVRVADGVRSNASKASSQFTPYAGVVLDLNKAFSVYASYADIFQPQTQSDVQGRLLDPRTGRQFEAGVRVTLLNERVNGHAAIFRIEDRNRAVADPANPLFSLAAGEVRSTGAEVEISGLIAEGWNLTTGYSYNDTEYVVGTAAQQGTPFRSTAPKHLFNLWTRYTLKNGLSVGGGARYSGEFFNRSGTIVFRQGDYLIANAQIGYAFTPNIEATVTVNNLFDKNYYSYVNTAANGNRFGEPRSVRLTLNTRW
jgi:outer membrane receptor for ferric coprogen and ferric-rhodotorulic acid